MTIFSIFEGCCNAPFSSVSYALEYLYCLGRCVFSWLALSSFLLVRTRKSTTPRLWWNRGSHVCTNLTRLTLYKKTRRIGNIHFVDDDVTSLGASVTELKVHSNYQSDNCHSSHHMLFGGSDGASNVRSVNDALSKTPAPNSATLISIFLQNMF